MAYVLMFLLGMIGGGISVFVALDTKRRGLLEREQQVDARRSEMEEARHSLVAREQEIARQTAELKSEREATRRDLQQQLERVRAQEAALEARVVSYGELQDENRILKRDLQNVDVNLRKLELDREMQEQNQDRLDRRSNELGSRYLKENVKWVGSSLNANNFVACKQRLQNVIESCRAIGFDIPPEEEAALLDNLREDYEKVVRSAFEREEQARIKAQQREEFLRDKEIERELQHLDRQRLAIQAALDKALAEAKDEHSAEVQELKARLAEAEAKSQRAISQAQLTKSGHVYVISNIGSFGEGMFKIGLTRRLEPQDRVRELGDASVPFPFDVHMMIYSDDAPTLENALHRALHKLRVNKVNPRKEFFRTDFEAIRRIVEENHGEVQYVADAEALEYHQSLEMSDEDEEFIDRVYEGLEDDDKPPADNG